MTRDEIPGAARFFYEGMDANDEGLNVTERRYIPARTEAEAWIHGWYSREIDRIQNGDKQEHERIEALRMAHEA